MSSENAVDIGSDRQLFVDEFWIDQYTGITQVLHEPIRREVVLAPEQPWEAGGLSCLTTFVDDGRIRGWYRADPGLKDSDHNSITCCAESDDGICWTKPAVGLIEFAGAKANNIVWTDPGLNLAPFRDRQPGRPSRGAL